METVHGFNSTERYEYDFGECSGANGWAQVDTGQDASYYGNWANPEKLQTFSYCEGDTTRCTCETPEEFVRQMRETKRWHDDSGYGFKGIDALCNPGLTARFRLLGLGDLLH